MNQNAAVEGRLLSEGFSSLTGRRTVQTQFVYTLIKHLQMKLLCLICQKSVFEISHWSRTQSDRFNQRSRKMQLLPLNKQAGVWMKADEPGWTVSWSDFTGFTGCWTVTAVESSPPGRSQYEHSAGLLCGPELNWSTWQECDSTIIWPKRNEMSHVRNAGNFFLCWGMLGSHRPRQVFTVLKLQTDEFDCLEINHERKQEARRQMAAFNWEDVKENQHVFCLCVTQRVIFLLILVQL